MMSRQEVQSMLTATVREKEGIEKRLSELKEQLADTPEADKRGIAWLEIEIGQAEKQLKGSNKELEKYQKLAGSRPATSRSR